MENEFIIAYDLNKKESKDYQELYDYLDNINAIQVQESVWGLKSSKTAKELRDLLKSHIKKSDRIFVAQISDWAALKSMNDLNDL